jgi:hypothetical protein
MVIGEGGGEEEEREGVGRGGEGSVVGGCGVVALSGGVG